MNYSVPTLHLRRSGCHQPKYSLAVIARLYVTVAPIVVNIGLLVRGKHCIAHELGNFGRQFIHWSELASEDICVKNWKHKLG
jgi:hypothetical protein